MPSLPTRVKAVSVKAERTVELTFADGSTRIVDLAPYLWGPVFDDIARRDEDFRQVFVDDRLGTIAWPNGADLDPDVLYGAEEPVASTDVVSRPADLA